jgi:hypothetical protein
MNNQWCQLHLVGAAKSETEMWVNGVWIDRIAWGIEMRVWVSCLPPPRLLLGMSEEGRYRIYCVDWIVGGRTSQCCHSTSILKAWSVDFKFSISSRKSAFVQIQVSHNSADRQKVNIIYFWHLHNGNCLKIISYIFYFISALNTSISLEENFSWQDQSIARMM